MDAIRAAGLVKTFGPTRALDGLDLEVATGEVHGLPAVVLVLLAALATVIGIVGWQRRDIAT